MKNRKLVILVGLPGSGKTTYAKREYSVGVLTNVAYYDLDSIEWDIEAMDDVFLEPKNSSYLTHIVDGLILTNYAIVRVIEGFKSVFSKDNIDVEVVHWLEDRAACVHNDSYRREQSSKHTILNVEYESVRKDIILERCPYIKLKLKSMVVVKKSALELNLLSKGCLGDVLKSEGWSLGGYYEGSRGSISVTPPSPQPLNFEEFDDLIFEIMPDISFMQYKRLYPKVVKVETKFESDYYGGGHTTAWYSCNVRLLLRELEKLAI